MFDFRYRLEESDFFISKSPLFFAKRFSKIKTDCFKGGS